MWQLLRFEFRKLWRMKSLYICFGVGFLLLILGALFTKEVFGFVSAEMLMLSALSDASYFTLLGVFLAIYICDDFANHTIKNIYAKGYSRYQVFLVKYLVALLVSLTTAVLCFVVSFVLGETLGTAMVLPHELYLSLGLFLLVVIGYQSVYFGIAWSVGKIGGGVALNLIGPTLVVTVLSLVLSLMKIDFSISEYWFNDLILRLEEGTTTAAIIWKTVLMALGYTIAAVGGAFFLTRKREA